MSSSTRRPLRQTVALITQKTHVFAGTLADNLRLVRPDATDADLGTILDAIGAAAWVDLLSDCQHTRVGTGGHTLTASQAQYLALARVLLLTPEIVILDEATAEGGSGAARALDDGRTHGRVRSVRPDHRAPATQATTADIILVMDHSRVAERGSHKELVARDGRYAQLRWSWIANPLIERQGWRAPESRRP